MPHMWIVPYKKSLQLQVSSRLADGMSKGPWMSGHLSHLGSSRLWLDICPGVSWPKTLASFLAVASSLFFLSPEGRGMEVEGMGMALGCQVSKLVQSLGRGSRL